MRASVVVPTLSGGDRLTRVLDSLAAQTADHELIVVDDGAPPEAEVGARVREAGGRRVEMGRNSGFAAAVNAGAAEAKGESLIMLNDDCVVDPGFVEAICSPLDTRAGVTMTASVMRDHAEPDLIDSAGMQLDRTLLVFDYLNGESVGRLSEPLESPVGPSAAAAAFDLAAFRALDGFDTRLFAYWEDVDLVLRMRKRGLRCELASEARGTHEHSATFGSGSARKNYLTGYGRGYVLRKWAVARSPARWPAIALHDGVMCAGQAVIDRNAAGLRGRVNGWRAATPEFDGAADLLGPADAVGIFEQLGRRLRRRRRLRARSGDR